MRGSPLVSTPLVLCALAAPVLALVAFACENGTTTSPIPVYEAGSQEGGNAFNMDATGIFGDTGVDGRKVDAPPGGDGGNDAAKDAARDAPFDVAHDAPKVVSDAPADVAADAVHDAPRDAHPDSGTDARHDAPTDARHDAEMDAPRDATKG
jgi:hypothetical protein